MSEQNLRQQIRKRLKQAHLDENQYSDLEELMARENQGEPEGNRLTRRGFVTGVATAAGLAGIGVGSWWLLESRSMGPETLTAEVLRNHKWLKPLDLNTERFDQLAIYFADGLNFELIESHRFPHDQLALEGGRYCSLGGIKAAQIVFRTPEGQVVTFYQTRYRPEKAGPIPRIDDNDTPVTVTQDGYRVDLWVEQGILMASAREVDALPGV